MSSSLADRPRTVGVHRDDWGSSRAQDRRDGPGARGAVEAHRLVPRGPLTVRSDVDVSTGRTGGAVTNDPTIRHTSTTSAAGRVW